MTDGNVDTADESVPTENRAVPRSRARLGVTLLIAAAVIASDQITKHWVLGALTGKPPRHVIWTLQWNLSRNSGMAFSTGQGVGPIIGVLAIVVVVFILRSVRGNSSRLVAVAAGLVLGGALGNLTDRLFRGSGWLHGSVIDWIDFQWFPIFNIADMGVDIGGGLFVIWALFSGSRPSAATP
jgi:signal peptidase II